MIFATGGGSKVYAVIGVLYPPGSTVTCYNGTKTLAAKTTTGRWLFQIPTNGTWTVTATDGTQTVSQTVEITEEHQVEIANLSYTVWLIQNGVPTETIGGFSNSSTEGVALTVRAYSQSYVDSTTAESVNTISGSVKPKLKFRAYTDIDANYPELSGASVTIGSLEAVAIASGSGYTEYTIDISSVESAKITLYAHVNEGTTILRIEDMWMED